MKMRPPPDRSWVTTEPIKEKKLRDVIHDLWFSIRPENRELLYWVSPYLFFILVVLVAVAL